MRDNGMCLSLLTQYAGADDVLWLVGASSLNCACSYLLSAEQRLRVLLGFVRHSGAPEALRSGAGLCKAVLNLH